MEHESRAAQQTPYADVPTDSTTGALPFAERASGKSMISCWRNCAPSTSSIGMMRRKHISPGFGAPALRVAIVITAHKMRLPPSSALLHLTDACNIRKLGGAFPWVYGEASCELLW